MKMPEYIVIQSTTEDNNYLRYRHDNDINGNLNGELNLSSQVGILQFTGGDATAPHCIFQVKPAATRRAAGSFHLKCCLNNKYVVGVRYPSPRNRKVNLKIFCAAAHEPEEDLSDPFCTLFNATSSDGGREFGEGASSKKVQFQHVVDKSYLGFAWWNDGIPLLLSGPTRGDLMWVFDCGRMSMRMIETADFAEFLVELPRFVAIRSRVNGKFMRYLNEPGKKNHRFLQCSEDNPSHYAKFEIEESRIRRKMYEGGMLVHVKCCYSNTYWMVRPGEGAWIYCGANRKEEDRSKNNCTVFRVTSVEDDPQVLRIRHQLPDMTNYLCLTDIKDSSYQSLEKYGGNNNPVLMDGISAFNTAPRLRFNDTFTFVDWDSVRHDGGGASSSSRARN